MAVVNITAFLQKIVKDQIIWSESMTKSTRLTAQPVVKAYEMATATSPEQSPRVRLGDSLSPWAEAPKVRLGDSLMPW
jgi:hypothetical protein